MRPGYTVVALDGPVDLIGSADGDGVCFVRDGIGVVGSGTLMEVPAAQVSAFLAGLEPVGPVPDGAPRPRAVGARPFRPDRDWSLTMASRQVIVDDAGQAWQLEVVTDPDAHAAPTEPDRPVDPADPSPVMVTGDGLTVTPIDDPATWRAAVATATVRIAAGALEKVVLARAVEVRSPRAWSVPELVGRLARANPGCYLYHVDGLVGASPELLVERSGTVVRALPMAGTTRRDPDPVRDDALADALFASASYRHEHQVTIDMVHDTLLGFASYVDYAPDPSLVRLATVTHLASRVEGQLSDPAASVLELVEALHPTPAVSGRPLDAALASIAELEPHDRGRYAGTVGWVDGSGDGSWAVTIRCAQLDPAVPGRAVLHAGCGIVAASDPDAEFAESEAKLRAALSALLD